jgi:hypothetical protein
MRRHCNYCGQPLPEARLGVRLTPLKARIFDLIQRGGEDGVPSADLRDILNMGVDCLNSHVWQINDALLNEPYKIRSSSHCYRLVRG